MHTIKNTLDAEQASIIEELIGLGGVVTKTLDTTLGKIVNVRWGSVVIRVSRFTAMSTVMEAINRTKIK
jgi:hypothetical protein